ncbi:MAG: hypothetical protein LKG25_08710 [Prevotella sp.]|jgi:hypothetical protein|nr:hypothetical protein [Prevotella sp.]MCI1282656.1 hypothetical protein [Prevotella sp.]
MKKYILQIFCLLAALFPLSAHAQEGIRKAFDEFIHKVKVEACHNISKDPETFKVVSQTDLYAFSIPESKASLLSDIQKAFETDTEKAYSQLSANDLDHSLMFLGQNGARYYVGKNYPHYLCNIFPDASNKLNRYAYSIEWNDPKDGIITGNMLYLYGEKPVLRKPVSLGDVARVMNTLGANDSLILPKSTFAKIDKQTVRMQKSMFDTENMDAESWMQVFDGKVDMAKSLHDVASGASTIGDIYGICKHHPQCLSKEQKKRVVSVLANLKAFFKDEPVYIYILEASADCMK